MGEMEAMISATMSFASQDAEAEQPRSIDIAAMLISLSDELNDLGQSAQYSGPNHALADCQPTAMKRALRNLMENAVKYGDDAQVSLEETEKCRIIRIADKGTGIPEDQFEFVFAPFRRIEVSRNRETGASASALPLRATWCAPHGGEIFSPTPPPTGG